MKEQTTDQLIAQLGEVIGDVDFAPHKAIADLSPRVVDILRGIAVTVMQDVDTSTPDGGADEALHNITSALWWAFLIGRLFGQRGYPLMSDGLDDLPETGRDDGNASA